MKLFRNDFVVAFLILIVYLLTNSYIYAWDDQHLEIPLLKHLIDPTLYKGDYYVEGLAKNFSSYLYPILAKFIKISQIPTVYFILFLLSRFAMFYWVLKLWEFIGKNRGAAIVATLMFFLLGRTEEFLYRTFSHQEFSYIFMFAGIYYFYRERYLVAALIFGLGANFHAIYNLFPMLYMLVYLTIVHYKRFDVAVKAGITFVIAALPFLCWQIPRSLSHGASVPVSEWMPLYLLSCPQNFFFGETPVAQAWGNAQLLLEKFTPYLALTALYAFHLFFNPRLRKDGKLHAIIGTSWALVGIAYYFHYIHPSRLMLDLNLVRVEQFVRFFLMGYTTLWAYEEAQNQPAWRAFIAAILFVAVGAVDLVGLAVLCGCVSVYGGIAYLQKPSLPKTAFYIAAAALFGIVAYKLGTYLRTLSVMPLVWHKFRYAIWAMTAVFIAIRLKPQLQFLRILLICVPLIAMFISFATFHYQYIQAKAHAPGFWQFQRNWQDMQLYVRDHTPKDALILTPYNTDLGGFRIRSERKVLVCYRDCGIIGFDYGAAVEWNKRIHDIEGFKMLTNQPIDQALLTAILKYKVDYVVFMKYYEPKDNPVLKKLYQNEVLSLYQVLLKPGA